MILIVTATWVALMLVGILTVTLGIVCRRNEIISLAKNDPRWPTPKPSWLDKLDPYLLMKMWVATAAVFLILGCYAARNGY
ncbi:MAG: hypothetical protein WC227_01135 [Patescibacteria group bacterium]|jgi:hypothetical protein